MMSSKFMRAPVALCVAAMLSASGCGGGGGSSPLTFTLLSVVPAVSNDLNGGDSVTITGTNFVTVQVAAVTFGGAPGTNLNVLSETQLTVTTPPAPGGSPGPVTIEVTSLKAGAKSLIAAYTYVGPAANPQPQTISPTQFTATGAESFTIGGANLGTPGGTVNVTFQGVGTVTAQVSGDATLATGNAPVSPGAPPTGPLAVTLDTGVAQANVPTPVSYGYTAPAALGLPFQTAGNASRPQRLAAGFAVACSAGLDAGWGTADDEVVIITGPPNPMAVTPVRRANGSPVGYLSAANSIPAVLDPNNVCVYSIGPDKLVASPDDRIVLVSSARTAAPVVTDHLAPGLNSAPVKAISATRVAATIAGPDGLRNTADDLLFILTFSGTSSTAQMSPVPIGPIDTTPGPGNFSIPLSPDGNTIFVLTGGGNGTLGDSDDSLIRFTISTGVQQAINTPFFLQRPVALSATLAAAPGAGPNGVFGDLDDELSVVSHNGTSLVRTPLPLQGMGLSTAAVRTMARLGATGLAVPTKGPDGIANSSDDVVMVTTNPGGGTLLQLPIQGRPLLVPLGSGGLLFFSPGPNLLVPDGDETILHLDATATTAVNMATVPLWNQASAILSDADRAFAVGNGPDGLPATGDEQLLVYQSRALGQTADGSTLPLAPALFPVAAGTLFSPIGPGWGLAQSPGFDGRLGTADDQVIFASY